ncbi:UNVERIFIED_CONTAM: hypothetical protein HDU68_003979 [Siphonaria sp. JEL0065]|nr:hypothetical protein HDU68_003979 [Siphonaria sp. JEL0065]
MLEVYSSKIKMSDNSPNSLFDDTPLHSDLEDEGEDPQLHEEEDILNDDVPGPMYVYDPSSDTTGQLQNSINLF